MIRLTWLGFVVGAVVFAALGMWMNTQISAPMFSNPGPVGILALIGGTTSALVSPLLRRRLEARRRRLEARRRRLEARRRRRK